MWVLNFTHNNINISVLEKDILGEFPFLHCRDHNLALLSHVQGDFFLMHLILNYECKCVHVYSNLVLKSSTLFMVTTSIRREFHIDLTMYIWVPYAYKFLRDVNFADG